MKIAVIGAGIAGLTAGRELAKAGHEVVIFEERKDLGERFATIIRKNDNHIDYGYSYFKPSAGEFGLLLEELINKDLLKPWEGTFAKTKNGAISDIKNQESRFIATKGMKEIGNYLGRMIDIRTGTKVGGLTHIGANRTKKRTWMLNFPTAATENYDAVIIATTARKAYAILNTTIDEIETLTLVREIDEIEYSSEFTLIAGYGDTKMPDWNVLECDDDIISWISNESSKNKAEKEYHLVIHSTPEFARKHQNTDHNEVAEIITNRMSDIFGEGWAALPNWQQIYFWKYHQAKNPLPHNFMEIKSKETPLALIGGYMAGNDAESAYLSGLKLAQHWVEKYAGIKKKPA